MTVAESMDIIANHIKKVATNISHISIENLIDHITNADRIFLIGAGRSGFIARSFAMRLMHLGFNVYSIEEATMPPIKKEDLVIIISGSGETSSIANLGNTVKLIGSKLAIITSNIDSHLAKVADSSIIIPKIEKHKEIVPLGTIFEITSLVFLDSVIAELMIKKGIIEKDMNNRHMLSIFTGLL